MGNEILDYAEIARIYDGRWVLIEDIELDERLEIVRGVVVADGAHKDEMEELAIGRLGLRSKKPFAVRGFVPISPDVALWLSVRPVGVK